MTIPSSKEGKLHRLAVITNKVHLVKELNNSEKYLINLKLRRKIHKQVDCLKKGTIV